MPAHITDKKLLPFYSPAATPVAVAMVMKECSVAGSTSNPDQAGRPARDASAPTYADIVSDKSAARRAAKPSHVLVQLATLGANPAVSQTVLRPSCQRLPSQGGIEVRHMKISSRQLSWWDSPSPGCDRDLTLSSSQ